PARVRVRATWQAAAQGPGAGDRGVRGAASAHRGRQEGGGPGLRDGARARGGGGEALSGWRRAALLLGGVPAAVHGGAAAVSCLNTGPCPPHGDPMSDREATVHNPIFARWIFRSEERRVGKECRSRWLRYH